MISLINTLPPIYPERSYIMKKLISFLLALALLTAGCSKPKVNGPSSARSTTDESESSSSESESSAAHSYKMSVVAQTNFELKNGGFEPEFTVTLTEDMVLENDGDNLTVVFPDGKNTLLLGWCFIHEIREYDKYDNPLYCYEDPEKSLGYISHDTVTCGPYECLRITNQAYGGKENAGSFSYRFAYFVPVNDFEILYLSFFAPDNLEDTLKTQEKFVANIER